MLSSDEYAGLSAELGYILLYSAEVQGFTVQFLPESFIISDAKSYQLQSHFPVQWYTPYSSV